METIPQEGRTDAKLSIQTSQWHCIGEPLLSWFHVCSILYVSIKSPLMSNNLRLAVISSYSLLRTPITNFNALWWIQFSSIVFFWSHCTANSSWSAWYEHWKHGWIFALRSYRRSLSERSESMKRSVHIDWNERCNPYRHLVYLWPIMISMSDGLKGKLSRMHTFSTGWSMNTDFGLRFRLITVNLTGCSGILVQAYSSLTHIRDILESAWREPRYGKISSLLRRYTNAKEFYASLNTLAVRFGCTTYHQG